MSTTHMTKRDYYEVLGVDRSADDAALKKAYRALAMKYHPDKNPGDAGSADKMKELNEAYAVLSDESKRRLYDRYGHAGLEGYSQEDIFRGVDFSSLFGDVFGGGIFEQFFGGSRRPRGPQRGDDLRYDLEISLEEVASGVERVIELSMSGTCPKCHGTGAAPGGVVTCEQCRGAGQIAVERRSGYTVFRQVSACPRCRGTGQIIKERCEQCAGKGLLPQKKEVKVSVPKGAGTGNAIRVAGEGAPGDSGAPPGDLYVVVSVRKHPRFERHGDDLYLQAEIGFPEAALGGKATVPGLSGDLVMEVPEGTQTGAVLRVGGEGLPRVDGRDKGDLYVVFKVVTPTKLSARARDLLRQFAETTAGVPGAVVSTDGQGNASEGKKAKKVRAKKVGR